MMEVNGQRLELEIAPADTDIVEASRDLVVLAAPAHERLVETVHLQQVALPVRLVATADGVLSNTPPEQHPAQQQTADRVTAPTDAR
jgi:hypothetical protein